MLTHTAGQFLLQLQNEYMKDDFLIKIETWHKPDLGTQENVHKLEPEVWKNVEVVHIDIADRHQVLTKDYKPDEDPSKYKSLKTGRGPLGPDWKKVLGQQMDCPHMCAYKLVTVKFKWWGLQNKVENFIHKQERRLFTNFHRQLFCWLDRWVELTMEDIRRMEDETKRELDEVRVRVGIKKKALRQLVGGSRDGGRILCLNGQGKLNEQVSDCCQIRLEVNKGNEVSGFRIAGVAVPGCRGLQGMILRTGKFRTDAKEGPSEGNDGCRRLAVCPPALVRDQPTGRLSGSTFGVMPNTGSGLLPALADIGNLL
ncbi:hypothetical protein NDU88_003239 [Pleurodeles waltl]|uniref:Phosphatidylinositol transfer protein alpha isoform n=1 Tax=Pleurodeles waltl TaxID=8319 RepID=A0AAV7UFF5_PLEWA|nr:hypothetical protein NDU88_003239 [Pleurodeles waltl]